jgi:hypothetical protein
VRPLHLAVRPDHCLSDLTIDQLLAGELSGQAKGVEALAHVAVCESCRARRDEIQAERPLMPEARLFDKLGTPPIHPPSHRRTVPIVIGLLAVAAGILVLVRPAPPAPSDSTGQTRLKGGDIGLEVLVHRSGQRAEPLLPDVPLHPGDVLGFRVRSQRGGYLAIVSIDGAGKVSSYVPAPGVPVPHVAPGEQALEGAVKLDGVLGRETLFAVICGERSDAARAMASAEAAASALAQVVALDLPCEQTHAVFHKDSAP